MRELWETRAHTWRATSEVVASGAELFNRPMVDGVREFLRTSPRRWLDVASGTGEPAATILADFPQLDSLVVSDFAPTMCVALRERFVAYPRVAVETIDMMAIAPMPPVDVITCRFGIMFVPDARAALVGLGEVLAADGVLCLMVWDSLAENDFFRVFFAAAEESGLVALIDSVRESAFSCAGEGLLAAELPDTLELLADRACVFHPRVGDDNPIWEVQGQMMLGIPTDDPRWAAFAAALPRVRERMLERNAEGEFAVTISARLVIAKKT